MSAAEYFKPRFEALKHNFASVTKHVHLVPSAMLSGDLLKTCNIEHDEKLIFKDLTLEGISMSDNKTLDTGGLTVGFLHQGNHKSAIFINKSIIDEPDSDLNWVWRYNALHHELMHALDMMKQKNFNRLAMTVDLIAAEAFADIKTLKHLSADQHPYMGFALREYSRNILFNRDASPFRSKIYDKIIMSISAKSIEAWTSECFLESLTSRWNLFKAQH